jgi:serine/threonine protein kinase
MTAREIQPMTRDASSEPVALGGYRLHRQLGEGGMGVVHLGTDDVGREVAVKVLRAHIAHDPEARARLAREVSTLRRVRHPLVADVLDADVDGEQPYVVTRFVPGPGLDVVVRDHGPLDAGALLRLGRGLSSALAAIHAVAVVHRDLKPANVLMLDGDPVVIDFGIAHVADDVRLTSVGLVMGTPGYLSPEVIDGDPVTRATDWWGWAATLAFAASGRPPFGRGPMDVVLDRVRRGASDLEGVDGRLRPLLRAALTVDPALRPGARDVLLALDRYAAGDSATVTLPVPSPPLAEHGPGNGSGHRVPPKVGTPTGPRAQLAPPAQLVVPPTQRVVVDRTRAAPQRVPGPVPPPAPAARQSAAQQSAVRQPAAQQSAAQQSAVRQPVAPAQPRPQVPAPGPDRPVAGGPSGRTTVALGLMVALIGFAAADPLAAALLGLLGLVLVRAVDRGRSAYFRRRTNHGPRRTDGVVATVSVPWHLAQSVLLTVLAAALPIGLGTVVGLAVGSALRKPDASLLAVMTSGRGSVAVAAGALTALLLAWWGPGGQAVRRGSQTTLRVLVPSSAQLTVLLLMVGIGSALSVWAVQRGGPDWPALILENLPQR